MRLLNSQMLELHDFGSIPPHEITYAILSHTWEDEEVIFQDMADKESAMKKKGWDKVRGCCEQACRDGFDWVWIDTCCIDKTSSAELSETINSMYQWYEEAEVCYVYLSDFRLPDSVISDGHSKLEMLSLTRWWRRGWTLQELIAPYEVQFYDRSWNFLGTKLELGDTLENFHRIPQGVLFHEIPLSSISVAERFSWAARRLTTRTEDVAYCLLGIFSVNMPLLYGEGHNSFNRLQEEILKSAEDYSMLAWQGPRELAIRPVFATSADAFPSRSSEPSWPTCFQKPPPYVSFIPFGEPPKVTSRGLQIWMLVRPVRDMDVDLKEIKDYLSAADLQTVIGRFHQAHSFSPRAHPESASFYLGALQSPCRRPGVLSWSLPVLLLHRIASSTHSIPQFVIVNGMIAQIPLATFEQDLDKMPAPVSVPWRQSSVYLCFGEAERAHGNIAYMLKVETRFPSDGSILPALVKPTCCHYDLRSEDGSAMWACVKVYWREQRDSDIVTFYVKGGDMELELMTSHDLKKRGIDPNQPLLEEVVAHHLRQRAFPNAFLSKSKGIVAQGRMAISEGWDLVVRVRCAHLLLGRRYCLSVGVERSRD